MYRQLSCILIGPSCMHDDALAYIKNIFDVSNCLQNKRETRIAFTIASGTIYKYQKRRTGTRIHSAARQRASIVNCRRRH